MNCIITYTENDNGDRVYTFSDNMAYDFLIPKKDVSFVENMIYKFFVERSINYLPLKKYAIKKGKKSCN